MLYRVLGSFNVLVAVAVAINMVATPLYHQGGDFVVWATLNWFMAAAILISIIESATAVCCSKTCCDGAKCSSSCSSACALFCASVVVGLLFFNAWFTGLMSSEPAEGIWMLQWNLIDAVLPVVAGITGVRLWRMGASTNTTD